MEDDVEPTLWLSDNLKFLLGTQLISASLTLHDFMFLFERNHIKQNLMTQKAKRSSAVKNNLIRRAAFLSLAFEQFCFCQFATDGNKYLRE